MKNAHLKCIIASVPTNITMNVIKLIIYGLRYVRGKRNGANDNLCHVKCAMNI